jgi:hypothetical protein
MDVWERFYTVARSAPAYIARGRLQNQQGVIHVLVGGYWNFLTGSDAEPTAVAITEPIGFCVRDRAVNVRPDNPHINPPASVTLAYRFAHERGRNRGHAGIRLWPSVGQVGTPAVSHLIARR